MFKLLRKYFFDPDYQKKKSFLKSLAIFQDLRERELGYLIEALHTRAYKEGEMIFMEGDVGRALFILETGKVNLTKRDGNGKLRKIFSLEPGDFFGEMALLELLPRTASAVATERSTLHLLYRSKLDDILHSQPHIGISIMTHLAKLLSNRLRRASALSVHHAPPTYG